MRSTLLSLALALPLPLYAALSADPFQERRAGTSQEPAAGERKVGDEPQDKAEAGGVDIFGRPRRTSVRSGTHGLLQGCWRLTDIELADVLDRGRKAVGALLVHDEFLAFEVHMAWPPGGARGPTAHQSFIAEYELTQGRRLKVTTVVGSFIEQRAGVLDWETTGFAREYQVSVTGDRLVLTFGQGNKMSFVRQRAKGQGALDIFGRERTEAVGERDIFGRERTEAVGERDIFGRPRKPSEGSDKGDDTPAPAPGRGNGAPR